MGRTTKWLKNFFGIKRDKEKNKQNSNFSVLFHNPATIPPNISPSEASWIQSFYTENEKEQNKHAIAVAAATAAAADAAVAAAQAAVAVVRLTSNGRFCGRHEIWAAVKIQTVFRGYLARKALRALKGLVKLQAIVRGYLVRKQATRALHSVQAIIRAQATIKSQKFHRLMNSKNEANRFQNLARRSMERFDDTRSEYMTASNHSRRLSCSNATINNNFDGINSPKIVEMDTISGRPKSRKSRTNNISKSDFDDNPSFYALSTSQQINYPTQDQRNFQESDWGLTGEECRFSTAQSTPRFTNSCSFGGSVIGPITPKSVCNDNLLFREYGNFTKNYMASTQSFKAKLRSHSAPKQRPQSPKKRLSMNEMMESRNSFSGVRMQKSCSQAQEIIDFKNAVMGKLHKSNESPRETDKNCSD